MEGIDAAEEAAYSYQRADGTVEHAASAEDARERCPVLGKMSLEQANVLLELAAIGQEKIDSEAQRPQPEKPAPKPEAKPEKPVHVEKIQNTDRYAAEPEQSSAARPEHPVSLAELAAQSRQMQESVTAPDVIEVEEVHVAEVPEAPAAIREAEAAKAIQSAENTELPAPSVEVRETAEAPQPQQEQGQPPKPEPRVEPAREIPVMEVDRRETPIVSSHVAAEQREPDQVVPVELVDEAVVHVHSETLDEFAEAHETVIEDPEPHFVEAPEIAIVADEDAEAAALDEVDVPIMHETETVPDIDIEESQEPEERERLHYEPEVIETYKLLTNLIEKEKFTKQADDAEATEAASLPQAEAHTAKPVTALDIEGLVEAEPVAEVPVTLEQIKADADEKPLEKTLIQLAQVLEVAPETPEAQELVAVMRDINESLAAIRTDARTAATGETELPGITPELTAKMLTLLRIVGYEKPDEAIVRFVTEYSTQDLLRAFEYISQLAVDDNRKEFAGVVSAIASDDDEHTFRYRIGQELLALIKRIAPESGA